MRDCAGFGRFQRLISKAGDDHRDYLNTNRDVCQTGNSLAVAWFLVGVPLVASGDMILRSVAHILLNLLRQGAKDSRRVLVYYSQCFFVKKKCEIQNADFQMRSHASRVLFSAETGLFCFSTEWANSLT